MLKTVLKIENPEHHASECLVITAIESKKLSATLKKLDRNLNGAIVDAYSQNRFVGKTGQTLLINTRGVLAPKSILLAGMGKIKNLSAEILRQVAGTTVKFAEKSGFKKISFLVPGAKIKDFPRSTGKSAYDPATAAIAEGAYLGLYKFDHYKSDDQENPASRVEEIALVYESLSKQSSMARAIDRARIISEAVCHTRDLIHHPSNTATPSYLARSAATLAKKNGMKCSVLETKDMKKLGMGALLGVSQGAQEPPKFIILEYMGGRKKDSPVVLVGKGITFDTGGISLKPAAGMDEMKMDMSGGAAVLGAMQAVSGLSIKANVVGIVPAVENMPGGNAIKPGDILKTLSGKTVEVLNTDAEGRLILCDALTYSQRYKPKAVIDLATLTGAVIHALGHQFAAIISNNSKLTRNLIDSGHNCGEPLWELPLTPDFEKSVKSSIADLKNIAGPGFGAGTITGGAFLKAFIGDQPWAHLDIAGTAWSSEDKPYAPKGASGFGVRLLLNYLEYRM